MREITKIAVRSMIKTFSVAVFFYGGIGTLLSTLIYFAINIIYLIEGADNMFSSKIGWWFWILPFLFYSFGLYTKALQRTYYD